MKITIDLNETQTNAQVTFEKDGEKIDFESLLTSEQQRIVNAIEAVQLCFHRAIDQ